ncbi:thiol reductant ABC exporter subunit CydD [Flavimobilis marinus]|uniref:ATP-binding cassette, subfamily C, CydD n=1 Tax=Flavimobilis marinus TaxID=285351 RepID=A0A1I2G3H6_9MICO|nr:thiol reductant ABC exporter subunit CydD [Flavimobilis marinus]GHG50345.1 thiol reductant ABC exporter subunit CydD [Flavimobilis marinus]SFF11547.1 ATP-binding cassette, subfamily C, CydD [Flavimobilis marinus]
MKPLDPRLLRYARAARRYVVLTAATGVATTALVVGQAVLLAAILAPTITDGRPLADSAGLVAALAAVVVVRALVVWVQERYAHRAASRVIADLRGQVVDAAVARGPRWLADGRGASTVTLVTRGLDDLEPYFVRYVPQLLLAALLTPATLLVVGGFEWVSGVIIGVTIPLVPMFMILVGRLTQGVSERRLVTMQRLSAQVLDLVAGIPTLRAFGRERGPGARVRELGEAHRRATMGTLRVAFLSGMVLELLTTLSVAVVAVGIGLRMVYGHMDLFTGLAVLIMAPEVYLPLRQVGLHFHASTDGIAAANQAFEVLDGAPAVPSPAAGSREGSGREVGTRVSVRFEGVSVRAPGRDVWAPAGLSGVVRAGAVTALAGPNGAGKTTAVLAMLGLLAPDAGRVLVSFTDRADDGAPLPEQDLAQVPADLWHRHVAWVPQRAHLSPGTILDAVLDREASPAGAEVPSPAVLRAAALTGLDDVVAELADGWSTRIGQGGHGLSLGQRQRIALTRALVVDRPLVVLDEPTAHLDSLSADQVLAAITALRERGCAVVVVAHREALLAAADHVLEVRSASIVDDADPAPQNTTLRTAEVGA